MGELDMACKKIYDFLSVLPFSRLNRTVNAATFSIWCAKNVDADKPIERRMKLATDSDKVLGVAAETFSFRF